jgi:hypothetical protein
MDANDERSVYVYKMREGLDERTERISVDEKMIDRHAVRRAGEELPLAAGGDDIKMNEKNMEN